MKTNQELSQLQEKFRKFYDENLYEDFVSLEEKRKQYLSQFILRTAIILTIAVVALYISNHFRVSPAIYVIIPLLLIPAMLYPLQVVKNFSLDAKKLVLNKILSFWGNLCLKQQSNISDREIGNSALFDGYNRRNSSDNLSGDYKGLKVLISEEYLQYVSGSGKHRSVHTIFKGVLVLFNGLEAMKDVLIVKEKVRLSLLFKISTLVILSILLICSILGIIDIPGLLKYIYQEIIQDKKFIRELLLRITFPLLAIIFLYKNKKLEKVNLEALSFDKNWLVKSSSQIKSRCILTPKFMEKMLEIKNKFKGQRIDFSMYKDKVMIAIHSKKDMFEVVSLFKPTTKYSNMEDVVSQFYCIFSLVDFLNLKDKNDK